MTDHSTIAKLYFDQGFGCAQSVLASFSEEFGMDNITARKIAIGFGSGMGRMGDVCGALTGGFMVIGLKYGKINPDGSKSVPATETSYALVNELVRRFRERNHSMFCKELTGLDLSVPENREYAKQNNIFNGRCAGFVQDAVAILEELLQQPV
jgi:C_GCAxxG_C_C family probable redox protein